MRGAEEWGSLGSVSGDKQRIGAVHGLREP